MRDHEDTHSPLHGGQIIKPQKKKIKHNTKNHPHEKPNQYERYAQGAQTLQAEPRTIKHTREISYHHLMVLKMTNDKKMWL